MTSRAELSEEEEEDKEEKKLTAVTQHNIVIKLKYAAAASSPSCRTVVTMNNLKDIAYDMNSFISFSIFTTGKETKLIKAFLKFCINS